MKIIQIAVEGATSDTDTRLFALTDDGRVFMKHRVGYSGVMDYEKEKPWEMVEPIEFGDWEK